MLKSKERPRKDRREAGITLVEIMVVVAIIAIIGALAVPDFRGLLPSIRVNGAARGLIGDLLVARTKSIKENTCYKVVIHTDQNFYEIVTGSSAVLKTEKLPLSVFFGVEDQTGTLPAPLQFIASAPCTFCGSNPTGTVYFSPTGQSVNSCGTGAGPVDGCIGLSFVDPKCVYPACRGDRVKRIGIVGLTGAVKGFL